MPTVDGTWRRILGLLEVRDAPNVFVLGSFARRVTVYAQQVRALNLVDALCGLGRLRQNTRVAVVGAGAGGLTAAAAMVKTGIRGVTLFEKETTVLPIQRSSRARYLHPHIYDWPFRNIEERRAGLPVLDWQAQYAAPLAAEFESAWRLLRPASELHLDRFGSPAQVKVGGGRRIVSIRGTDEPFDVIVLAVGFGVEAPSPNSSSYWADLNADDPAIHARSWLVSGARDGALTDLMRLGLRGLNHRDILEAVVAAVAAQPGVTDALKTNIEEGRVGAALFDGVDPDALARRLNLRDDAVTLVADEASVFGSEAEKPRSSVLNRLIAWVLWKKSKVKFLPGKVVEAGIRLVEQAYAVPIRSPSGATLEERAQHVILRHGPEPTLRESTGDRPDWLDGDRAFRRGLADLRREWRNLYDGDEADPTLSKGHWTSDDFVPGHLSLEFADAPAILLRPSRPAPEDIAVESAHRNSVDAAVHDAGLGVQPPSRRAPGKSTRVLVASEAIEGVRPLARALRVMQEAPIVVVDVTEQHPGILFLLGVRAASRRGITVAVVQGDMSPERWDRLAFNLRSLRIVAAPDLASAEFGEKLATCLAAGRYRLARRANYLDLPVFDVIRDVGAAPEDYAPVVPSKETLVLCPFDPRYTEVCWPHIRWAVKNAHAAGSGIGLGPARRALELDSPEVLDRRLFGAMRLCDACVVDLTFDRANVYFELGVRLAANPMGAAVVRFAHEHMAQLKPGTPHVLEPAAAAMDALFGTRHYTLDKSPEVVVPSEEDSTALISPRFVFDTVGAAADPELETGARDVAGVLRDFAGALVGPDTMQEATSPLLFRSNPMVLARARRLALESKLALALYQAHRRVELRDSTKTLLNEITSFAKEVDLAPEDRANVEKILKDLSESTEKP